MVVMVSASRAPICAAPGFVAGWVWVWVFSLALSLLRTLRIGGVLGFERGAGTAAAPRRTGARARGGGSLVASVAFVRVHS